MNKSKGLLCSINGNKYEKEIYNIINKCKIDNILFNTQKENELGGSSNKNDIICNYINKNIFGIEIKKYKSPDWMQCSIKYNNDKKIWESTNCKNTKECQNIFNDLINNINIYDGDIPPFMINPITYIEWVNIKKETNKWNDIYIKIPSDIIRKLYYEKGCKYIQISNGYGLYHLGEDICNFDVPIFDIEQQLRIRTKIHSTCNKKGFCVLSVMIACQPINIKNLIKSKYSLDDINKLPKKLIYNNDF